MKNEPRDRNNAPKPQITINQERIYVALLNAVTSTVIKIGDEEGHVDT